MEKCEVCGSEVLNGVCLYCGEQFEDYVENEIQRYLDELAFEEWQARQ